MLQGLDLVLPFPRTELLVGNDSSQGLESVIQLRRWRRPLIVTDRTLMQLQLPIPLMTDLTTTGAVCTVFDQVPENPLLSNAEAGLQHFQSQSCDSLIAVGGGSVIDCAKGFAARAGRPNQSRQALRHFS